MRERKYYPKDIQEQADKLISDLRNHPEEWRKIPYRYICLFCGVPLRNAQPILVQLRACPNIEYRYLPTAAKVPTIVCHYTAEPKYIIEQDGFIQFSQEEFNYVLNKIKTTYDLVKNYSSIMLLMIFVEQLLLDGFRGTWKDLPCGAYAVDMGVESVWIERATKRLERLHILKRLGMSRMYRLALSEKEFKQIENSAYAKQQEEIIEKSRKAVEDTVPQDVTADFNVLQELNDVAKAAKDILEASYIANESIIRQQIALQTVSVAMESLKEKEAVYAGMTVRIDAVSKNYENAIKEAQELRTKNNELRHLSLQEKKFYDEQKSRISQNLETMMGNILSAMEEYFSLPTYEKNKAINGNRVKTRISRTILDTIDAIQKGKDQA